MDFIGFGILSPVRRSCKEILDLINESGLKRKAIVGLAPGDYTHAGKAVKATLECIKFLKKNMDLPVFAGCSSPRITSKSSEIADGILFNYVKPEYIDWILKFAKNRIFFAAYGPSLILPSNFFEDLLIASAIVVSSKDFVKNFGFEDVFNKIKRLDFQKLIRIRQNGKSVRNIEDYKILNRYSRILINSFTISGSLSDVIKRITDLLKKCDHVILSDPFFRDVKSMKCLGKIVKSLES